MRRLAVIILGLLPLGMFAQLNVENIVIMGRQSLYYEDYVTAISRFNEVLQVRPRMASVYYYRAYAKFSLEDFESAEQDCSTAIGFNPFFVEYHQLRALCRIKNGDFTGALADYDHVLKVLPDDGNSRYNRSLCHLELKEFDAAERDMDTLLLSDPKNIQAHLILSQIYLEKGDTLAGLESVEKLLKLSPHHHEAWRFKGLYALQKNDNLQADSCLTKAIEYGGRQSQNYLARAQARHGLHRYNDALDDYDRAIKIVPNHFVAHYNRGLLRSFLGDDNRALEDFDFVLKVEPDNTLAVYNRAEIRERVGDYQGAEADYTLLLKEYPDFLYGYVARARCRRKLGQYALAQQDETKVARAELDAVYGKRKNKKQHVRKRSDHDLDVYDELIEDESNSQRPFTSNVKVKVQDQKVDELPFEPFDVVEVNYTLSHDPDNPNAKAKRRFNEACALANEGKTEEALRAYDDAIGIDDRLAEAYFNRALLKLKRGEDAKGDLSKAGELGVGKAYAVRKKIINKK